MLSNRPPIELIKDRIAKAIGMEESNKKPSKVYITPIELMHLLNYTLELEKLTKQQEAELPTC